MRPPLLARIDARDRQLFSRLVLDATDPRRTRRLWRAVTHLGGARATVIAAALPATVEAARPAALLALGTLALSHLLVQFCKRSFNRPRPSQRGLGLDHLHDPDAFSFPSGHSAAAMSVAIGLGWGFPLLAVVLYPAALLVGLSRVVLGVHYPGDVLAGQLLAVGTGALLVATLL